MSLSVARAATELVVYEQASQRAPRPMVPSPDELAAHAAFLARLKDPVWLRA